MKVLFLIFFCFCFYISKAQPGWEWAYNFGADNNEFGRSIAIDNFGNIYVTGYFDDSINFESTTLYSNGYSDFFLVKYNKLGNLIWAISNGSPFGDASFSVAVDENSNSYITGTFTGNFTIGTSSLNFHGGSDIFVAKYDSTGNPVWARSIGGTTEDIGRSVAVDLNKNVIVTGEYNSANISFGANTFSNNSIGFNDVFIFKFDESGNEVWGDCFGDMGHDIGKSVTIDQFGNAYITGNFIGNIILGIDTLAYNGGYDIFIIKYDSLGNWIWAKSAGGSGNDYGSSISTNSSGNIFITGYYNSTNLSFDTTNLSNQGVSDVFITKLDPLGNEIWAKGFGGIYNDYPNCIKIDSMSNLYITGYFDSPEIIFGLGSITTNGAYDIWVAKFDSIGNSIFAKSVGSSGTDISNSVAVDNNGDIFISGSFASNSINFGAINLINNNNGNSDVFIAKLGDLISSINYFPSNQFISFYPNPASNSFEILTQQIINKGKISIFNVLGIQIFETSICLSNKKEINLENISPGIYFVTVYDGLISYTEKLIIN